MIKIGSVELTEDEVRKLYEEKKYICTSNAVYQIFYSVNAGYYGQKIITVKGIARRGRFYTMDASEVNRAIGKNILNI